MSARRLLALALAAIWLLPIVLAGGVAAHVALEHGEAGAHPLEPGHGSEHSGLLADLLTDGHLHSHAGEGHAHTVAATPDPGLRSARPLLAPPSAAALDGTEPRIVGAGHAEGSSPAPPPRPPVPTLLALLSTLRI